MSGKVHVQTIPIDFGDADIARMHGRAARDQGGAAFRFTSDADVLGGGDLA